MDAGSRGGVLTNEFTVGPEFGPVEQVPLVVGI